MTPRLRHFAIIGLALVVAGCGFRSDLRLEDGLVVESMSVQQADAVQGESEIGVAIRVRNDSSVRESLGLPRIGAIVSGADRSADYVLTPVAGNPDRVDPGGTVDLSYRLAVAVDAATGAAILEALVTSADGAVQAVPDPSPVSLLVLRHARLEVTSQTVDGATCRDGRVALFRAHVRNTGESTAALSGISVSVRRGASDASAEFTVTPVATVATLAAGAEIDLDLQIGSSLAATALGPVTAEVVIAAADTRSAADAAPVPASVADLVVHQPASLSVPVVSEINSHVSTGQTTIAVTATVVNGGTVPAVLQTGSLAFAMGASATNGDYVVMVPPGLGTTLVVPSAGSIAATFTVNVQPTASSGATTIGATFSGSDAVCNGAPGSTPATLTGAWTVDQRARLVVTTTTDVTSTFAGALSNVTVSVQNTGEAAANAVAPSLAVTGCATCVALTPVNTTAANIPGGGTAMFTWTTALTNPSAAATAVASLDGNASGTDANSAATAAGTVSSVPVTVEALLPTACFTFTPSAAAVGAPVSFDASCSSDVESADAALVFEWDFDGNGLFDATGMNVTGAFATGGSFGTILRVTDPQTRTQSTRRIVPVRSLANLGCVTIAADENNAGATPMVPGGTGFSLREAITWASATAGAQTVCFDASLAGTTVTFTLGALPALGVQTTIAGRPDVTVDFGMLLQGFSTNDSVELHNLHLRGVAPAGFAKIVLNGNQLRITGSEIEGGGGHGLATQAAFAGFLDSLEIADNRIHGNPGAGIRIAPASAEGAGLSILRNEVYANGGDGMFLGPVKNGTFGRNFVHDNGGDGISIAPDNGDIVNNTVARNAGDGLVLSDCGCGPDSNYWNNLLVENGGYGIRANAGGNGKSQGENWIFGNVTGATIGGGAVGLVASDVVGVDPKALVDGTLDRLSPCRNSGALGGPDATPFDPGMFLGTAVDVGSWESPR